MLQNDIERMVGMKTLGTSCSRLLLIILSFFVLNSDALALEQQWQFVDPLQYVISAPNELEVTGDAVRLLPVRIVEGGEAAFGQGSTVHVAWQDLGIKIDGAGNVYQLPDDGDQHAWIDMGLNVLLYHLNQILEADGIVDYSGLQNHAVIVDGDGAGNLVVPGRLLNAMEFSGTVGQNNDIIVGPPTRVLIGDDLQSLTMMLWFKTTTAEPSYLMRIRKPSPDGASLMSILLNRNAAGQAEPGFVGFLTATKKPADGDQNGHSYVVQEKNLNDGQWHHIAAIVDGTNRRLYLDGNLAASDKKGLLQVAYPDDDQQLSYIAGAEDGYGSLAFAGSIDEAAMWRRVLSGDEIKRIYDWQSIVRSGIYESKDLTFGDATSWNAISWMPLRPYYKELPDDGANEFGYPEGNADMTGNILLMHLNGAQGTITVDSIVADSSGNSKNGIAKGILSYDEDGVFRSSLKYGNNSHVEISELGVNDEPGGKNTVEFWMKWDGSENRIPFSWDNNYSLSFSWGCFGFYLQDSNLYGIQSEPLKDEWVHVAAVFHNGGISDENSKLYINGEKVYPYNCYGSGSAKNLSATPAARVGGWALDTNSSFRPSKMDEVAIYDRELSEDEVQDHFKRGAMRLKFQARVCEDLSCEGVVYGGPDGTPMSFYSELLNGENAPPTIPFSENLDGKYFQYKAFLESNSSGYSPVLESVSLETSSYPTDYPYLENVISGPQFSSLTGFSADVELIPSDGEAFVSYQLSNDGDSWYYHDGQVWKTAVGHDETNTSTEVNDNITSFAKDVGDGFFDFRAYLHSGGSTAVALKSVSLEYSLEGAAIVIQKNKEVLNLTSGDDGDVYRVVLNTKPAAEVTVMMETGGKVVVDPQYLVFTPANWNVSQKVTVKTATSDAPDVSQSYAISHAAVSEDKNYDGIEIGKVLVKVSAQVVDSATVELEEPAEGGEATEQSDDGENGQNESETTGGAETSSGGGCSLIVR